MDLLKIFRNQTRKNDNPLGMSDDDLEKMKYADEIHFSGLSGSYVSFDYVSGGFVSMVVTPVPSETPTRCGHCQQRNHPGQLYCEFCGAPL